MLKLTLTIFPSYHHHMKAISLAQHSSVISLLQQGYSFHQMEAKISQGKSNIGRINKEMDKGKENNKAGCPPKLTSQDK